LKHFIGRLTSYNTALNADAFVFVNMHSKLFISIIFEIHFFIIPQITMHKRLVCKGIPLHKT